MSPRARLPLGIELAYGMGGMGLAVFVILPQVLLLFYLTDVIGLSPGLASLVLLIPLAWSLVVDPAIGNWSDRTRTRWGRRLPFMAVSAILLPIGLAVLFAGWSPAGTPARFAVACASYVAAATAHSLFTIPYLGSALDLTDTVEGRTRLSSFRGMFLMLGLLVAGAGAPVLVGAGGGGAGGFRRMGMILALLCGGALLACVAGLRRAHFETGPADQGTWAERLAAIRANPVFAWLILAYLLQNLGTSIQLAALPFEASHVWRDSTQSGLVFLVIGVASVAAMPVLAAAANRFGRLPVFVGAVAAVVPFSLLFLIVTPAQTWMFLAILVANGAVSGATQVFPLAMLGDAADWDRTHNGYAREGLFTGVWSALDKGGAALGAAATGTMLAGFGYAAEASNRTPIPVLFAVVPAACFALSLLPLARLAPLLRDRPAALETR